MVARQLKYLTSKAGMAAIATLVGQDVQQKRPAVAILILKFGKSIAGCRHKKPGEYHETIFDDDGRIGVADRLWNNLAKSWPRRATVPGATRQRQGRPLSAPDGLFEKCPGFRARLMRKAKQTVLDQGQSPTE